MSTRRTLQQQQKNNELNKIVDEDDQSDHVFQTKDDQGTKYKWEARYERSWDSINEDDQGLRPSLQEERNQRNRRQRIDSQRIRRGMQRHICLILDLSKTLASQDLKPNRYQVLLSAAENFIKELFDQNPIAQLSLIITKNAKAEKISDLSGNPNRHIQLMKAVSAMEGDPSIQNSLDVALSTLCYVPKYGTREIIVLYSSLTTCDPSELSKTIQSLKKESVRVSFIHLAAELFICKHIAEETNGVMNVVLNEEHLQDCLMLHCQPPPTYGKVEAALIEMGFPHQYTSPTPMMCVCHEQFKFVGYTCPRCTSKFCELPTDCQVCSLSLVSSPHLARSYHHLFQIPLFQEVPQNELFNLVSCYGCQIPIKQSNLYFKCPQCHQVYCLNCDQLIHESLHNCPGCENQLNQHHLNNNNNTNNGNNHHTNGEK